MVMTYDRPPAPDDLRPLEDFVNSAMFLRDRDAFATPDQAARWLAEHDLLPAVSGAELSGWPLAELVRAREAIRDFLDPATAASAVPTLNDIAASTLAPPSWTDDGQPRLTSRTNNGKASAAIGALIGRLVGTLFTAGITGETSRLKICQAPDCRWVFYDRSPSRRAIWCSMDICGARHKMRAYRSRRQSPASS